MSPAAIRIPLRASAWRGMRRFPVDQYTDSVLGLVDASIIALAERLRITRVLTLDQRHFRFVRPRHCAAFEVVL